MTDISLDEGYRSASAALHMGDQMGEIRIIETECRGEKFLLVNFSDGTFAEFSVDDLLELKPDRGMGEGEIACAGQDYL